MYSYRPDGDNPIFDINGSDLQPPQDFVAFSDNGTGDYYGWRVESGACVGPVLLLDHEIGALARHSDSLADWLEEHVRAT